MQIFVLVYKGINYCQIQDLNWKLIFDRKQEETNSYKTQKGFFNM